MTLKTRMKKKMKINWKKRCIQLILPSLLLSTQAYSHEEDDPVLASLKIDKLETANKQRNIEADAWIGKDLNKFWLKTDIENYHGEIEHAEIQALYSHAIAPFWDIQMGIRKDIKPIPTRTWAVLGVQGLAPYFFDLDAVLFVGEAGRTAARISAEYDLLLTQRLILAPEVEINLYGQNDAETNTGSGLSTINLRLRLRYEIHREFAPYIGANWNKKFGKTKDLAKNESNLVNDANLVAGIAIWF